MGNTFKVFAMNLCSVFLAFSRLGDVEHISVSKRTSRGIFLCLLHVNYSTLDHTVNIIINAFY